MKYFEITLDRDSYRSAPQIINWYERINVRLINWECYHLLPDRKILPISPSPDTIFTDIVTSPFLLVSPVVKDVIRMYGDDVVFKEIILSDSSNKIYCQYYLPIMEIRHNVRLSYVRAGGENKIEGGNASRQDKLGNIFWLKDKGAKQTIINLDMAESLLRRNVKGIKLREIIICEENR